MYFIVSWPELSRSFIYECFGLTRSYSEINRSLSEDEIQLRFFTFLKCCPMIQPCFLLKQHHSSLRIQSSLTFLNNEKWNSRKLDFKNYTHNKQSLVTNKIANQNSKRYFCIIIASSIFITCKWNKKLERDILNIILN